MIKFQEMTRLLEVTLGPDTGDVSCCVLTLWEMKL